MMHGPALVNFLFANAIRPEVLPIKPITNTNAGQIK
jgi:hypothetical protein